MRLNEQDKNKLRDYVQKEIYDKVPNDKKIKIEKSLLEELLFDDIVYDKEKNIIMRLPVWSGEFLSGIDLSEVDFTNVSWARLGGTEHDYNYYASLVTKGCYKNISEADELIEKKRGKVVDHAREFSSYMIDYSDTNAKIDLTKSFEALNYKTIMLVDCDFENVDLSNNDLTGIENVSIFASDLSDTNLVVTKNNGFEAYDSYLDRILLTFMTIDAKKYFTEDSPTHLSKCHMTNCGVNIELKSDDFKGNKEDKQHSDLIYNFVHALDDRWAGCILNGKMVYSYDMRRAHSNGLKQQYKELVDNTYAAINDEIAKCK